MESCAFCKKVNKIKDGIIAVNLERGSWNVIRLGKKTLTE